MAEDGIEILEENLTEAKQVMETANQKHEEIKRRLAVVEEELERAVDKVRVRDKLPLLKYCVLQCV